jgi:LPXTG-motif cell wall-anchored protein
MAEIADEAIPMAEGVSESADVQQTVTTGAEMVEETLEEIADEEVPLDAVPETEKTNKGTFTVAGMIAAAFAALLLLFKRKKDDEESRA